VRRLEQARVEIAAADEFDYQIVNDDFQTALDELERIVDSGQWTVDSGQ
jgi:guanylate kinase